VSPSKELRTKRNPKRSRKNLIHININISNPMDKKAKKIASAAREVKKNPPKILAKTAKKFGAEKAKKQKIAIILSKARQAGAKIPKKKR
jgi:hypothetical protein